MPARPETSAAKLALAARQARADGQLADVLAAEPIAIVGLGCRFPGGGDSPEAFWRALADGVDAVRTVPADRWDVDSFYDPNPAAPGKMSTRWGAFLDRVDGFDPAFFGIAPREAASMDPQQRLLLEVAWEALEDAGQPQGRLAGSRSGVFVAIYGSDYAQQRFANRTGIDAYTSLGTAHHLAADRLAFWLDLHGPSLAINTACSSSLVAVHLACQSLRARECDLALAGGVSLILSPDLGISLSKWGFMAADGRCKTFDARADGFVRGEGCGVVTLRRLADALGDGDRILAVIRGSAVNQDGRSSVLTAPSGPAQERVIRDALQAARVDPAWVSYVEAHGTGTAIGDPIELEALVNVVGAAGPGTGPCVVGSVKTNLGHLEAAAGVAGLIKTVLAFEHEQLPPHLHFTALNPHASLDRSRIEIDPAGRVWPRGERPRFAGVSSFGFGGTNAHVVLEEAPRVPAYDRHPPPRRPPPPPAPVRSCCRCRRAARRRSSKRRHGFARNSTTGAQTRSSRATCAARPACAGRISRNASSCVGPGPPT
jgi:acyl transferase domain-containing protein